MAWIESHETLSEHPKTKRLAKRLGVSLPTAVGHLHYLWWWSLKYAQDGDLSVFESDELADAARWDGDSDRFIQAMVQAGFMDEDRSLHDWYDYAGKLLDQREKNAERMREARERKKKERAMNVQRTCDARAPATVPNLTVPNQTKEDDDDQSARPRKNVYERIEGIMQVRLVKQNYRLVGDEYHAALSLVNEGFTEDEIFQGITYAFETQTPKTFKYCAEVIRTLRTSMAGYKEAAAGGEGIEYRTHIRSGARPPRTNQDPEDASAYVQRLIDARDR